MLGGNIGLSFRNARLSILCSRLFVSVAKITNVDQYKEYLEIDWNGKKRSFGQRWLRDHCRCPECLDQTTFQRLYDSSKISDDIDMKKAEVTNNNKLSIQWRSGHASTFTIDWLYNVTSIRPEDSQYTPLLNYQLWNASSFKGQYPEVPYHNVMHSNEGTKYWMDTILKFGFGIVSGLPEIPEGDTTISRAVMEKLGTIRNTFFEPKGVWDITVSPQNKMDHADTAYTNYHLPPHVDGTYFTEPPGIQFFQIPQHEGTGGETILVDGFQVGNAIRKENPWLFDYLCAFPMLFHYYEDGISLRNSSTVFSTYKSKFMRFTFNNNDRMPCDIPLDQERYHYDAIAMLMEALNDPKNQISFQLRPDQLLVTNNWRVLHGRKSFVGKRRLVGAYIGMNEFLGRMRLLEGTPPEAQKQ